MPGPAARRPRPPSTELPWIQHDRAESRETPVARPRAPGALGGRAARPSTSRSAWAGCSSPSSWSRSIIFILKPSSFNVDVGISVLRAMSSVAIMSLGLTLVIVVGEIDLSFGAMYGLGANVARRAVDHPRRPGLSGAAARDRASARWSASSTALLVTRLAHPLLHRHARQLQSPLRRLALDHRTPRPSTRSIRRRASTIPESRARLLHRPHRELSARTRSRSRCCGCWCSR